MDIDIEIETPPGTPALPVEDDDMDGEWFTGKGQPISEALHQNEEDSE